MKSIFWTLYTSLFFLSAYQSYSQNFYLAKDGITCMCPDAVIGDSGDPGNGIIYTKRSRAEITETNIASTCFSEISDTFYSDSNFYQDVANNNSNDFPTNTTVARTIKSEDNPRLETILPVAYISMPAQPWNRQSNIIALDEVYSNQWEHYYYTTSGVAAEIFVPDRLVVFLEGGEFDALYMRDFIVINYPFIEPWVSAGGKLIISAASNISGPNWGAFGVFSYQDTRSPFGFVVDINDPFFTESPYSPIFPSSGPYYGNDISHNYLTGPDLNPLIIDNRQRITLAEKSVGSGIVRFSGLVTPWLIDNPNNGLWGPDPQLENLLYRIVYFDIINPTAVCQDFTVALDATGNATITAADIDNGSSDNESVASLSLDTTTFTCADLGENTVNLTVTDTSGNESTCSATVTVVDNIDPTAVGQDITVQLDAAGNATITTGDIDNGSSDNCGAPTLGLDVTSFGCGDLGANAVLYIVEDSSGNQDGVTITVTVVDNIAPTVVTQNITVELDATGNATITTADLENGTSDNCTLASLTLDVSSFSCADLGANTVTLTAEDQSGNTNFATATVTVVDDLVPTVLTQAITVNLDAMGMATITPADIDNGSSDNCTIDTYSLDIDSFSCANVGPNTVTLTVVDLSGNSAQATAVVTVVNPTPTSAPLSGGDQSECALSPLQTLTATANVNAGETLVWYDAPTGGNVVADPSLNALGSITYFAEAVNDLSSCVSLSRTAITLEILALPTPMITNNTGISLLDCNLTAISLTASGGDSYLWSTGETTAIINVTTPDTYSVTVTGANGCSDVTSVVITQDIALPIPVITNNTGATELTCNLTSINLTASGGESYLWSTGETTATIEVTTPDTYSVNVTGPNGCTDTTALVITQDITLPVPVITSNTGVTQLDCNFPSISLTASGGDSYLWSTGETTATIDVTSPDTYSVTVTGTNGCEDTTALVITEDVSLPIPLITNNTGTTELNCAVTTINLTASGGTSYLWSTGATTASIDVTTPDTYSVTVKGANGCEDSTDVIITQDLSLPIPVITNNSGTTELNCNVTVISLTASGGASYLWSNGATTASINVTSPDTYSVTVTGVNGCSDETALNITQDITQTDPPISAGDQSECELFPVQTLTASATVGASETLVWYDAATGGNVVADPTLSAVGSVTYYATAVDDLNGCESIFREPVTLEIIDAPSAPVSGGDITEVAQDPVQTITATATVNAGDLLTWFDTAVGGNVITDPSLNTPGTVTYYAESFDPTVGCDSPVRTAVTLTLTATCNDGIRNGDETGIDCGGSSCLECAPETILHEGYFETGWDGWIDGGVDCERVFGPEAYEGDYSIRLRADTGLEASMILENIDIDAFNWVIVDFYFYTKNLSHGERFILEYTDDLFYYTVAEFVKGEDFDNEQFYNKSVLMLRYNNEFSQHASWRFRAITNSQNDQVFIDQVTITGNPEAVFLSGASEVFMPPYLSLAPNPARDYISIKTSLEGNLDYTIYNFLGQVIHKGPYNGIEIPVYDLSTGLYFLEISNGDQKSHRKFVKE